MRSVLLALVLVCTSSLSFTEPSVATAQNTVKLQRDAELIQRDMCEVSPVVWQGRLCLFQCVRPASGGNKQDYRLRLIDVENGQELASFGEGYGLASAFVHEGVFYAFASRFEDDNWNDVTVFKSSDLKTWEQHVAVTQNAKEHLFNSSVCAGPDGFVMAYETNDPAWPAFTVKFATSKDLMHWTVLPDTVFGKDRYTACPLIRFANGYYYLLYLEQRSPRWFFDTCIARSTDLKGWEGGADKTVLTPSEKDEGINASDPDMIEFNGKTYLYFAVGDQRTWMNAKRAVYAGPMTSLLESYFVEPRDKSK